MPENRVPKKPCVGVKLEYSGQWENHREGTGGMVQQQMLKYDNQQSLEEIGIRTGKPGRVQLRARYGMQRHRKKKKQQKLPRAHHLSLIHIQMCIRDRYIDPSGENVLNNNENLLTESGSYNNLRLLNYFFRHKGIHKSPLASRELRLGNEYFVVDKTTCQFFGDIKIQPVGDQVQN